jgi:hypothetical protein
VEGDAVSRKPIPPAPTRPDLVRPGYSAAHYAEEYEQRAGFLEHVGGYTQAEAEAMAWAEVYGAGTAEAPRQQTELDLFARFAEALP